ncbi:shugoshin Sgo2 [Schizosaccharomyces japonicus yFS275]|uniref:Shugoshin Sgo2 n=1 Tax=Schizosaccharomyces japonicus (strain yFS275 / FY16936) TaxID=402676 RepID=B6K7B5_SCHJY|nr:shugoshin Sgo2 [Schizosaccharomyces japonicus yFS275]EEB09419.2 shugoshin Sgo2 [Schizosaccharomyces japonicus yFS275]
MMETSSSSDTLRKKRLLQNKEILRINKIQSTRIKELEAENERLLSENLDLRTNAIRLAEQLEHERYEIVRRFNSMRSFLCSVGTMSTQLLSDLDSYTKIAKCDHLSSRDDVDSLSSSSIEDSFTDRTSIDLLDFVKENIPFGNVSKELTPEHESAQVDISSAAQNTSTGIQPLTPATKSPSSLKRRKRALRVSFAEPITDNGRDSTDDNNRSDAETGQNSVARTESLRDKTNVSPKPSISPKRKKSLEPQETVSPPAKRSSGRKKRTSVSASVKDTPEPTFSNNTGNDGQDNQTEKVNEQTETHDDSDKDYHDTESVASKTEATQQTSEAQNAYVGRSRRERKQVNYALPGLRKKLRRDFELPSDHAKPKRSRRGRSALQKSSTQTKDNNGEQQVDLETHKSFNTDISEKIEPISIETNSSDASHSKSASEATVQKSTGGTTKKQDDKSKTVLENSSALAQEQGPNVQESAQASTNTDAKTQTRRVTGRKRVGAKKK